MLPRFGRVNADHENVCFLCETADLGAKLDNCLLTVLSAAKVKRGRRGAAASMARDGKIILFGF